MHSLTTSCEVIWCNHRLEEPKAFVANYVQNCDKTPSERQRPWHDSEHNAKIVPRNNSSMINHERAKAYPDMTFLTYHGKNYFMILCKRK